MTGEALRIRSYLTAQGAKLSPAAIVEKVEAAMAELAAAAASVPATRFAERPGPDEWSANEVMAHVVAAGARFGDDIRRVLDDAPAPPGDPPPVEDGAVRTAEAWQQTLRRDRAALFERALAADPSARLDRAIEHGMFGTLNWRETLLFMRLHDLDHAGQLRKIASALAAPASGERDSPTLPLA
jgi:hypothetical protein